MTKFILWLCFTLTAHRSLILRRHPSGWRVYKGKYFQLKYTVIIPGKKALLEQGPHGIVK